LDTNAIISLTALVISILGFVVNLWFSVRRIELMEKDLRRRLLAGVELHLASSRFVPQAREFLLFVSKSAGGDVSDLKLVLYHPLTRTEIAITPPMPLVFSDNLIQINVFPEIDALFQRLGVYDHTRTRLLREAPVPLEVMCTWTTANSNVVDKMLSFTLERDLAQQNQLEWTVHIDSDT
jgi:hypothetical protein